MTLLTIAALLDKMFLLNKFSAGSVVLRVREIDRKIKCINCDQVKFKGEVDKYKLSEKPRAELFLAAVKFFGDDRSTRLADIDSVDSLLSADIYSHHLCMQLYLKKYERETSNCKICQRSAFSTSYSLNYDTALELIENARNKRDMKLVSILLCAVDNQIKTMIKPFPLHLACVTEYLSGPTSIPACSRETLIPVIDEMIRDKFGLTLSQLRDHLSEKWPGISFRNHHIKLFISEVYGERISFCSPHRKNESEVVFPSSINPSEIVQKLQILDSVTYTGRVLREKLLEVDFGLTDVILDETALNDAYHKTKVPEIVMTFMSALLNIPKTRLMTEKSCYDGTSDVEEEEDGEIEVGQHLKDHIVHGSKYNNKIHSNPSIFRIPLS